MAGLGGFVDAVELRSNAGGFSTTLDGGAGAGDSSLMKLLQPAVTIVVGGQPINVAPWGEPAPGREWVGPLALLAVVAAFVGVGYLLGKAR